MRDAASFSLARHALIHSILSPSDLIAPDAVVCPDPIAFRIQQLIAILIRHRKLAFKARRDAELAMSKLGGWLQPSASQVGAVTFRLASEGDEGMRDALVRLFHYFLRLNLLR